MNILVTGGAGYIGSVMVPILLQAGHRVTVLDNFLYNQSSLLDVCHNEALTIVRGDVRDTALVRKLASKADALFPLACLVGAPLCVALLLTHDIAAFSALFFAVVFLFTWYNGPIAAVLFDVVPRGVAATVMGAYVFFIHIAGDAVALPVVEAVQTSPLFAVAPSDV